MTLTLVDVLGFAAYVLNVAGNLMLARQTIWGWIVRIVAIVLWFAYGCTTADMPMIFNGVTFFCINIYGYRKWKLERAKLAASVPMIPAPFSKPGVCKACGLPEVRDNLCSNHDG